MKKILVSSCLLGNNCRYDGGNCHNKQVIAYLKDKEYITVCPEELGGLPTPRLPSEIVKDKVLNIKGEDVTAAFVLGANKVIELAKKHSIELAICKSESPSCGLGIIHDGTFSGNLIEGNGICVNLFLEKGIKVISEKDLV